MIRKKHKKLIKVPYIDQTKEWPTGCESVSAVMLLQYLGADISVKQFVEQYLEKEPLVERDGRLYGGNPWKVFVGNPADDQSMGCYAPVIKKALERVLRQGSVQGERPEPGVRENSSQEEKRSAQAEEIPGWGRRAVDQIGRASCRERV